MYVDYPLRVLPSPLHFSRLTRGTDSHTDQGERFLTAQRSNLQAHFHTHIVTSLPLAHIGLQVFPPCTCWKQILTTSADHQIFSHVESSIFAVMYTFPVATTLVGVGLPCCWALSVYTSLCVCGGGGGGGGCVRADLFYWGTSCYRTSLMPLYLWIGSVHHKRLLLIIIIILTVSVTMQHSYQERDCQGPSGTGPGGNEEGPMGEGKPRGAQWDWVRG